MVSKGFIFHIVMVKDGDIDTRCLDSVTILREFLMFILMTFPMFGIVFYDIQNSYKFLLPNGTW